MFKFRVLFDLICLLARVNSKHGKSKYWVVFIGRWAKVRLARLVKVLHTRKSSKVRYTPQGQVKTGQLKD